MAVPAPDAFTAGDLLGLFAALSDRITHAPDPNSALAAVTSTAVDNVHGVDFASISRDRGDHFQTLAPTSPAATDVDRLQYALASGPCIDAAHGHALVRTGDVRVDPRWPVYGPRCFTEHGVASMLSIHLDLDDDDIHASLNLYSRTPQAFTDDTATTAALLAAHGAIALSRLIARTRVANLTTALSTARTIGTAIGVLTATDKITPEQSFDLLRNASQHSNRKLTAIAADVIDTGTLP